MRILLAMVLALGGIGLMATGLPFVLIGVLEQRSAGDMYEVAFQRVGQECSGGHELHLDVDSGTPLDCVPSYFLGGSPRVDLPGFTDAQNDEVAELGERLGGEGLTEAEQRRIQDRVDAFVAAVPDGDRPIPDSATVWPADAGVWGTRRVWLGIGAAVLGVLAVVGCFLLARPSVDR